MPLAPSWPQLRSCLAFAPRPQTSLGRAWGLVGCTLPRATAGRALSEGREGPLQGPPAVAWRPRLSAARRAPGSQGPWLGSAAPHTQRLTSWEPSSCLSHVDSLALSSPAETCAGGWGLILRVWVPARSLNSGEPAPEARPAGGALRARLIGESTASSVASLLGRRGGSRAQSRGKPCLHGAKWASSTAEL